jgi:uncharacterized coiled-coil DUF342 family protein
MPEEEKGKEEKPKKKLFGFLKRGKEEPKQEEQAPEEMPAEPEQPQAEEQPESGYPEKEESTEDLLKRVESMLSGEKPEEEEQPAAPKAKPAEAKGSPAEAPKQAAAPAAATEAPEGAKPEEPEKGEKPKEEGKPKGKKEVSYEENVISSQEFEALESKEEKKRGFLSKLKGGRREEEEYGQEAATTGGAPTTSDLLLRIEKSEGRFEAVNTSIANVGERIGHLSEEIGELRSSLMERERSFRNVEKEFGTVKDIVENIEPAKFTRSLEGMKTEFTKSEAKLEGLDTRLTSLKKRMDELREVMDKIHGIKNLMTVADTVRQILEKMEEKKTYITKTASKTESMFVEVGEKLKEFEEYRNKIDANAEMLYELMRSVDGMEAKMEKVATKEALESTEERAEWLRTEYDDKVADLKDIISELVSAIREGDIILKGGKKVFAPKDEVRELKEKFDELRKTGKVGVAQSDLDKVHTELVDHIAESIRKGRELNKRLDSFESNMHQELVGSRLELSKALKRAHSDFGHDEPKKAKKEPKPKDKPAAIAREGGLEEANKRLSKEIGKQTRQDIIRREKEEIRKEKQRLAEEARKMRAKMMKTRKASKKKAKKGKK